MPAPPLASLPAIVKAVGTSQSILWTACDNVCVAWVISEALKISEITATPTMPVPFKARTLSWVMPPMAITGIETASQISISICLETSCASSLELVGNTAPTPK